MDDLQLAAAIFEGNELHISASIGIACYPNDGDTAGRLLKNADIAGQPNSDLEQTLTKKQAEIASLQEELDRLTFQYSELEKAYDKIINRDQFIVDLLEELSAAEVLIKNIREDSLHQISSLNAEIEALRSRSLWQCICSK